MRTETAKMPAKLAVNVSEAAELLSVSRPTMYEIINREDFNGTFRIGAKRLISVDALKQWIENQMENVDS